MNYTPIWYIVSDESGNFFGVVSIREGDRVSHVERDFTAEKIMGRHVS